jgi:CRP/FNR family transcriptional regulator
MLSKDEFERVRRALPLLRTAGPQLAEDFRRDGVFTRIPAGQDVFVEGDRVESIALMISGVVRVYKIGETGRQLTLYRFGLGQSCILTANAILSHQSFPAIATVEQDAEAVMVPADVFREWVQRHEAWRDFVFELLSQRLSTVMAIVDEVAFRRMDARVADWLVQHDRDGAPIEVTHQALAAELGSSREVISRLLEDFQERGIISGGRGRVEVLDPQALRAEAAM